MCDGGGRGPGGRGQREVWLWLLQHVLSSNFEPRKAPKHGLPLKHRIEPATKMWKLPSSTSFLFHPNPGQLFYLWNRAERPGLPSPPFFFLTCYQSASPAFATKNMETQGQPPARHMPLPPCPSPPVRAVPPSRLVAVSTFVDSAAQTRARQIVLVACSAGW